MTVDNNNITVDNNDKMTDNKYKQTIKNNIKCNKVQELLFRFYLFYTVLIIIFKYLNYRISFFCHGHFSLFSLLQTSRYICCTFLDVPLVIYTQQQENSIFILIPIPTIPRAIGRGWNWYIFGILGSRNIAIKF